MSEHRTQDLPDGFDADRDLFLALDLGSPRDAVWRCWTEAELISRWFAPHPWSVARARVEPRPGGIFHVVMRSSKGEDQDGDPGVYLEVEPGRRFVTTDALSPGWRPTGKALMTVEVDLTERAGGGTRYTAWVRHWTKEDCEMHREMGFHDGWTQCARQLDYVADQL